MDPMKLMIQQKLIANVIMDKCVQQAHLIFRDSWCSQERVIRFTTPFWKNLLGEGAVMYEAENRQNSFVVNCVYKLDRKDPVITRLFARQSITAGDVLQSWDLTNTDPNAIFDAFDLLISEIIPAFEKELENKHRQEFIEGQQNTVTTTRYERNRQAREACLAFHGYACRVCGMSFEKTYGPEFKDIIEVHHIVPLNQIAESYVVDPIHDLIPVCPNCHAAIHSKYGYRITFK